MVSAQHITKKARDAFLAELDDLCRRHHIAIDPCNCVEYEQCQHIALVRLADDAVFSGYAHDGFYGEEREGLVIRHLYGLTYVPPKPKPELPTW